MLKRITRFLLLLIVTCHAELVSVAAPDYHYFYGNRVAGQLTDYSKNIIDLRYSGPGVLQGPVPTDSAKRVEIRVLRADTVYHHITRDAALWSTFIPGAGQIYNEFGYRKIPKRKNMAWWKVPVIYGGLGVTAYYFYENLATARALKAEWLYRDAGYGLLYPEYADWETQELLDDKTIQVFNADSSAYYNKTLPGYDLAAKRRDMLGALFIAVWGFQVLEAYVDAHFVTFDVSQDLSLSWSPTVLAGSTPGVALRLEFN